MNFITRLCCALILLLTIPAPSYSLEEIRTITTRPQITLTYYIKTPKATTTSVLLLFPGSGGDDHFRRTKSGFGFSDDFLMRNLQTFIDRKLAVAVVGVPSDHDILDDAFRVSEEHYTDIVKLCEKLVADGYSSLYFISAGSGSLSAAAVANRPLSRQVKGVIFVSAADFATFDPPVPIDKITTPALIIHHEKNDSGAFTLSGAISSRNALSKNTTATLMMLTGGKQVLANRDDSAPAHTLPDFDKSVPTAIADWIEGKQVPEKIKGEER